MDKSLKRQFLWLLPRNIDGEIVEIGERVLPRRRVPIVTECLDQVYALATGSGLTTLRAPDVLRLLLRLFRFFFGPSAIYRPKLLVHAPAAGPVGTAEPCRR